VSLNEMSGKVLTSLTGFY